jgi:hypothetical protein
MKTIPFNHLAGFIIIGVVVSCFSCCVVFEGVVSNDTYVDMQGYINNSTATSYYLDISRVNDLENWTRVSSYTSINSTGESDVLANLNTSSIGVGRYGLRITAVGVNETNSSDLVYLTIEEICRISGDTPPCGEVTLREVIDFINQWINDEASLSEVVQLINAWASG